MVMRKKITKTADVTKNRIDRKAEWGAISSEGKFFFHFTKNNFTFYIVANYCKVEVF